MKIRDLVLSVSLCVFGGALVILVFFIGITETSGKRISALGLLFLLNGFRGISQYHARRFPENAAIQVQNTTGPRPMRVYRIVQYILAFAALLLVLIDTLTAAELRTPILILGGLLIVSFAAAEVITQIQSKNTKTE